MTPIAAAAHAPSGRLIWQSKDFTDEAQYTSLMTLEKGGVRQIISGNRERVAGRDRPRWHDAELARRSGESRGGTVDTRPCRAEPDEVEHDRGQVGLGGREEGGASLEAIRAHTVVQRQVVGLDAVSDIATLRGVGVAAAHVVDW